MKLYFSEAPMICTIAVDQSQSYIYQRIYKSIIPKYWLMDKKETYLLACHVV